MSLRQALISILHLFVVFAFFTAGCYFIALSHLSHLRELLYEKSTLIGLYLFLTTAILLISFYMLHRGRYLVIRMGVGVDTRLIRQMVEECFHRHFSKQITLQEVEVSRKSRLELKVSLASLDDKARMQLLAEAEKQLSTLLQERFGYSKPFLFTVQSRR